MRLPSKTTMTTTKQSGSSVRLHKVWISTPNYFLARGFADASGATCVDQWIDERLSELFKDHPQAAAIAATQKRHREELQAVLQVKVQEDALP